jgi:hypothetical protein
MEEGWNEETIYHSKGRRRDGDSGLRFHRWERLSLKDHVADLLNGGRRRLAGRRVPFTCEKMISQQ